MHHTAPCAEADRLRDRRRVGDLRYEDLLLAAYVGHATAHELLAPLDVPAETEAWIRGMERFDHPAWVRAALAASARLVPSDPEARASFVALTTRIGDWLDCPCFDHAGPIHAAAERCTGDDGTAAGETRARVATELLRAIGPDRDASLDAACQIVARVEEFVAVQTLLVRRVVGDEYEAASVRATIRDAIAPWALATDELESFLRRSA